MTTQRIADRLVRPFNSDLWHLGERTEKWKNGAFLACTGRFVEGTYQIGAPDETTCKSCAKALSNGKVKWYG